VQFVGAYPVTVMIYLVVTMAKQNIYISGRAANNRIERAIPQFMQKFGMEKEQATATAIRLESLGRLQVSGEPINKPKSTRGKPIPVMPAALQTVFSLMKRDNTPKTTQVTTPPDRTYTNAFAAAAAIKRTTQKQSTRSSRLRSRVTRGR
tara:strand:+ start:3747 stop:4196 length:450 start_codon:yes stop_codon:yes gene_type:complete